MISKKVQTAALYGLVDIGAEIADSKLKLTNPQMNKPFMNITDASRLVAVASPLINQYVLKNGSLAATLEDVQVAALPLLEKSVYNAVRNWMPTLPSIQGRSEGRLVLKSRGDFAVTSQFTPMVQGNVF